MAKKNWDWAIFGLAPSCRHLIGIYEEESRGATPEHFKTFDPDIKVGDLVIVPTHSRHKFTVVKITEADVPVDFDDEDKVRWIVGRVDTDQLRRLQDAEEQAIMGIKQSRAKRERERLQRDALDGMSDEEIAALPDFSKLAKGPVVDVQPAEPPAGD